jgi:hypothetical protein
MVFSPIRPKKRIGSAKLSNDNSYHYMIVKILQWLHQVAGA